MTRCSVEVYSSFVQRSIMSPMFTTNAPSTGLTGCHVWVGLWNTSRPPTAARPQTRSGIMQLWEKGDNSLSSCKSSVRAPKSVCAPIPRVFAAMSGVVGGYRWALQMDTAVFRLSLNALKRLPSPPQKARRRLDDTHNPCSKQIHQKNSPPAPDSAPSA